MHSGTNTWKTEEFLPLMGDHLCFITVTLAPRLFKYLSLTLYEMTINEISSILSSSDKCLLSTELTKDGNVHYHAVIRFRSEYNRILIINTIKKKRMFGFFKINEQCIRDINSLNRSISYLYKDLLLTEKVLCSANYRPELIKLL